MLECPQCHIKYGRKLQQCPNCGAAAINHETTQAKPTALKYHQFLQASWRQPLQTPWRWVNPQFGWVTFAILLPVNTATISLLMAGLVRTSRGRGRCHWHASYLTPASGFVDA
ncbi:hypothetical protein QY895_11190 [Latilactobacillus sakei]